VQIPLDYVKLAQLVRSEGDRRSKLRLWPVLNEQEFWEIIKTVPNTSISNQEELNLGNMSVLCLSSRAGNIVLATLSDALCTVIDMLMVCLYFDMLENLIVKCLHRQKLLDNKDILVILV
jgi:hypothetical protein